ncbi:MAG: plastocyanin/azurin family copper-binding protein [Cyclobacteriaceae bacterium]
MNFYLPFWILISIYIAREVPNGGSDAKLHQIRIEGMRFVPKILDVTVGDTVLWINHSAMAHNVISENLTFQSAMLPKNGEFTFVFTKAGTYPYYCQPHKIMGMKGTILVKAK